MNQDNYLPLLIHKPVGPTSFDIISSLRKITGIKKIGHAGTLDPLAKGLLIVLLGKTCKKQDEFMGLPKEYIVEATFGAETDTYDREGIIVHRCEHDKLRLLNKNKISEMLVGFVGQQEQTVPPFSAIKVNGQRLYKKARKGNIDFKNLPKRKINSFEIELLEFVDTHLSTDKAGCNASLQIPTAKIRVFCSKGTYVRSLVHDLGQKLGCSAYVSALIRTKIGKYRLEEAITVEEFKKRWNQNPSFRYQINDKVTNMKSFKTLK